MSAIPDPAKSFREPASENATRDRNEAGQFLNGHKKSRGRPKGSRTKLAEDVVTDVLESWRRDGPVVLARLKIRREEVQERLSDRLRAIWRPRYARPAHRPV